MEFHPAIKREWNYYVICKKTDGDHNDKWNMSVSQKHKSQKEITRDVEG
jgi:hypothetical protein